MGQSCLCGKKHYNTFVDLLSIAINEFFEHAILLLFRKVKPRFEKAENLDELPPPEAAVSLPPVIMQGSKGFNLQNSLQNRSGNNSGRTDVKKPLGKVRLAPL